MRADRFLAPSIQLRFIEEFERDEFGIVAFESNIPLTSKENTMARNPNDFKARAVSDGQGSVQVTLNLSNKGAAGMLAAVRACRKHDQTEQNAGRPTIIKDAFTNEAFEDLEKAMLLTDGLTSGTSELPFN